MPAGTRRPPPGAHAVYKADEALARPTSFIATVKDADGMPVVGVTVSMHLEGSGLLRPEGAHDAKGFTFQRTDESGVIQFTWLPGRGATPGPITLRASTPRGASLVIRRLS